MESLFSSTLLPVALAIITLGMGLSLSAKDFKHTFLRPKAMLTGLSSQLLLLPLLAYLIASLVRLDPLHKVGLMIIAACPGGATSNLVTYILRGRVALSISMTAINSLITLLTIPLIVTISLQSFLHQDAAIHLSIAETLLKVFLITILPSFAGTRIRHWRPELANRLDPPLRIVLPLLLLVIYAGVIFIDQGTGSATLRDSLHIFPYALLLNLSAMAAGYLVARIMRLRVINQITIAIEVGLQNSALAIVVAASLLRNNDMALVAVVYGSFSFFTTLFFGWLVKRLRWQPPANERGK